VGHTLGRSRSGQVRGSKTWKYEGSAEKLKGRKKTSPRGTAENRRQKVYLRLGEELEKDVPGLVAGGKVRSVVMLRKGGRRIL